MTGKQGGDFSGSRPHGGSTINDLSIRSTPPLGLGSPVMLKLNDRSLR